VGAPGHRFAGAGDASGRDIAAGAARAAFAILAAARPASRNAAPHRSRRNEARTSGDAMMRSLLTRRAALAVVGAAALAPLQASAAARPPVTVHKDPSCGCCGDWIAYLRGEGFPVTVVETTAVDAVKERFGVPDALASCHTAAMAGYVIEGHVPVRAIDRLLSERPTAIGIAVPGMPLGAPGMNGAPEIYEVVLFGLDVRSYGKFRGAQPI
jgi:hypothetical protein